MFKYKSRVELSVLDCAQLVWFLGSFVSSLSRCSRFVLSSATTSFSPSCCWVLAWMRLLSMPCKHAANVKQNMEIKHTQKHKNKTHKQNTDAAPIPCPPPPHLLRLEILQLQHQLLLLDNLDALHRQSECNLKQKRGKINLELARKASRAPQIEP